MESFDKQKESCGSDKNLKTQKIQEIHSKTHRKFVFRIKSSSKTWELTSPQNLFTVLVALLIQTRLQAIAQPSLAVLFQQLQDVGEHHIRGIQTPDKVHMLPVFNVLVEDQVRHLQTYRWTKREQGGGELEEEGHLCNPTHTS